MNGATLELIPRSRSVLAIGLLGKHGNDTAPEARKERLLRMMASTR